MPKKLTNKEFIQKSNEIHGNKYNYSKVKYINSKTKVIIICPKHGEFLQIPNDHLMNHGCPICANNIQVTLKDFIKKSNEIHENKYNYSKVKYKNNHTKITIICKKHKEFQITPKDHLNGIGCSQCYYEKMKLTTIEFIQKASKIHENKYDYSKVKYVNSRTKVCIICPEHGEFWQSPNRHLSNNNCPMCKQSKGEIKIANWLNKNNIQYKNQKTFQECKNKRNLPFDFYIPQINTCIEFDGKQHFKPIPIFGGEKSFKQRKINDQIKTQYCLDNNISLKDSLLGVQKY
ncbi:MAG: hypothetical protein ACOC5T_03185 [Elusimicrobiota bacterium]